MDRRIREHVREHAQDLLCPAAYSKQFMNDCDFHIFELQNGNVAQPGIVKSSWTSATFIAGSIHDGQAFRKAIAPLGRSWPPRRGVRTGSQRRTACCESRESPATCRPIGPGYRSLR